MLRSRESADRITVLFQGDSAYSLFPGGSTEVSTGGAAVSTFFLAEELSRDSRLDVRWVFTSAVDASALSHPRISIVQTKPPIRRGLPIVSRVINRMREIAPYRVNGRCVLIASPAGPRLEQQRAAVRHGVKVIVRVMSDVWVDLHGAVEVYTSWLSRTGIIGDSESLVHEVVHQTHQQKDLLAASGADRGVVIPGGWPHRSEPIDRTAEGHILWVGRCTALKRPWYFLELAELLPHEQSVMLLRARGAQKSLQQVLLRKARRIPNLRIVSDQLLLPESEALFDTAKVLVSTSEVEGFPVVFYQAGSAGIPIASLSFDPDGIIDREGIGVAAGGDIVKLADGIATLAEVGHPQSVAAAERCAEYFRSKHDVRNTAAAYKKIVFGFWGIEP